MQQINGAVLDRISLPGHASRLNQLAHVSLLDGKDNTSVGINTGNAAGANNTVVGAYAGTSLGTRSRDVVLIGSRSGQYMSLASDTVAIGSETALAAQTVHRSVFVGSDVAKRVHNAQFCTVVGYGAASSMLGGIRNTMVGSHTGTFLFNSTDNTFVGHGAGGLCRTGQMNVCVGTLSGQGMQAGDENVLVGHGAGANVDSCDQVVAVGAFALEHAKRSSNVVAIGTGAGRYAANATNAIFIGGAFGATSIGSGTTANSIFVGIDTGSDGSDNVYLGTNAGRQAIANRSVAVGSGTFANAVGSNNTVVGAGTGVSLRGNLNTVVGVGSGDGQLVGNENVVLGALAATSAIGSQNVVVGVGTAHYMEGRRNTVVGASAMTNLVGNDNVIVGSDVLTSSVPVENSIIIGSSFAKGNDLSKLANSVIVGSDKTLTDADNDALILTTPGLGEIIRATKDAVVFGASQGFQQSSDPTITALGSTNASVIARYQGQSDVWQQSVQEYMVFDSTSESALDGMYGPQTGPVYTALGYQLPGNYDMYIVGPDVLTAGATNVWNKFALGCGYVIQGTAYTHVYVHASGMICFGNNSLPEPAPLRPQTGTALTFRRTGPLLDFSEPNEMHACYIIKPPPTTPQGMDHSETTPFGLMHPIAIIRYEGRPSPRNGSSDPYRVVEVSLLTLQVSANTFDNIIRITMGPDCTFPEVYLNGHDLCPMATVSTADHNIFYITLHNSPTSGILMTPWLSLVPPYFSYDCFHVQLKSVCTVLGVAFQDVYMYRNGSIALGAPTLTSRSTPVLRVGYTGNDFYYFNVAVLLDVSQKAVFSSNLMDPTPTAPNTHDTWLRVEAMYTASDLLFAFEISFLPTTIVVTHTNLLVNAPSGSTFSLVYRGVTTPMSAAQNNSYVVSSLSPPHFIPVSLVTFDDTGLTVGDPCIITGNGAGLYNVPAESLVGDLSSLQFDVTLAGDGGALHNIKSGNVVWNSSPVLPYNLTVQGGTGLSLVTADSMGLTVESPGVFFGNGAGLTHVPIESLVGDLSSLQFTGEVATLTVQNLLLSAKQNFVTGFGGGPMVQQGAWDTPGTSHTIPLSDLAPGCDNISGTLYVHASNKASVGKCGQAMLSVLKVTGTASPEVLVLNQHASASLGTLSVELAHPNIVVRTDADCAVCWTFVGAV